MKRDQNPKIGWRKVIDTILIGFVCSVMIGLATKFGLSDKTTAMGLIILACSLTIAFLNLDRFDKVKAAGFEASLRKVVDDANATIDQLRMIAVDATRTSLMTMMASEFRDGIPLAEKLASHDRLLDCLKQIGATSAQIDDATYWWNRGVRLLYQRSIKHLVLGAHDPSGSSGGNDSNVKSAAEEINKLVKFDRWEAGSSEQIRCVLKEHDVVITPPIAELLEDYKRFEKTGEIRRKDAIK